jgi:hypothetical protein
METPATDPPKKQLSEKQIQGLKKARVALVKSRDEKRLSLHENALSAVVEKSIEKQLKELQEKMKSMEVKPLEKPDVKPLEIKSESEPEIEYRKKPKKKIVYISSSEEEEPEYKPKKNHKPKTIKVIKKAPIRYAKHQEEEVQDTEPTPQYNINELLFKSIFNR